MKPFAPKKHRSGRQTGASVSLFPFLAVLICTMGALIVLLVVLARQAKVQAVQTARAAAAKSDDQQKDLRTAQEDAQWRIEQLQASREATEAQLAEARLRLGHIEDHARRLREELARYEATLKDLQALSEGGSRQRSDLEAELARLKTGVAEAQRRLADAQNAASQRRQSFAVIPYEGRYATHRRPIYVECRADAIVLQPEGIELSEEDFLGPLGPGNPLASAMRAAREYMLTQGNFDPKQPEEPYPLLLVRPDGIEAYYAARAGLESWGSEFGYELIGGDWKLDYRQPDPQLATVVRRAVETARVSQARLIAAAPRVYGKPKPREYRAAPTRGGVIADGGPTGGTGSGFRPSRPTGAFASRAGGTEEGPYGRAGTGDGESPADAVSPESVYGGLAASSTGTPGTETGPAHAGGGANANAPYANHASTNGVSANGANANNANANAATNDPGSWSAAGGNAPATAAGAAAPGAAVAVAPTDTMAGRPPMEQQPGAARGGTPPRPGEWQPQERSDGVKRPRNNGRVAIESVAKTRGENWGLPDAAAGSVGITRPIRVSCEADRVVLLSEDGRPRGKPILLGPRTEDSIDDLVSAVWSHMESWGIAGKGMYWQPILKVQVAPDAEQRYEELDGLLRDSGMTVERKDEG